ncbi:MAG: alpha-galactosidase [Victivallaceae bacterium]|nr:alpha-galactosidase [Victivallaceae bacterium]
MLLVGDKVTVTVNNDGSYTVNVGSFELSGCRVKIELDDINCTPVEWHAEEKSETAIQLVAENEYGSWLAEFRIDATGLAVKLSGTLKKAARLAKLYTLYQPKIIAEHLLSQGAKMGNCRSLLTANYQNEPFEGFHQLMISADGESLQLSYPLKQCQPAKFTGAVDNGAVVGLAAYSDILHYGGLQLETEALTICSARDGIQLMNDYCDRYNELKKDFSAGVEPGWNSWDYYRWTITEEEVLKNAELIARDPVLSKHVKRIIVDDGWQYCYGEWEANHYFPNGMEYLAKELKKMGFKPGLWFAPTIVEPHCRIAQLDYDMLAMGESGQPCLGFNCMQRQGFLLDPTQEKVQKYLYNLFRRYADMGYEYFKLDFMGTTLNARKFADAAVPRSKIQELIVKPIYEAVHERAEILGCNYLFEAGNQYVDAVRIGSDIHAAWDHLKNNTTAVAARFWGNKKLWINDPDFALCRGFDTVNDPDFTRLLPGLVGITPDEVDAEKFTSCYLDMNRQQLEVLLSIVLASGGSVNLSDNMPRLNECGIDLAQRVVSAESCEAAIPLDLFASELPSYWLQSGKSCRRALLVNWTEEPQQRVFDLAKHGISASSAVNFWNDTLIPIKNGKITIELQPRSCLLAVI